MQGLTAIHARLSSCLEEALQVCLQLQRLTAEAAPVFADGPDEEVLQAIEDRQSLLNRLSTLADQTDGLLTQMEAAGGSPRLTGELEDKRRTIRRVLDEVARLDQKAMESIDRRMRTYKEKTLTARNRKHLSAYLKGTLPAQNASL